MDFDTFVQQVGQKWPEKQHPDRLVMQIAEMNGVLCEVQLGLRRMEELDDEAKGEVLESEKFAVGWLLWLLAAYCSQRDIHPHLEVKGLRGEAEEPSQES